MGDAKVPNLAHKALLAGAAGLEQHVVQLQVGMDDAVVVQEAQGQHDLPQDVQNHEVVLVVSWLAVQLPGKCGQVAHGAELLHDPQLLPVAGAAVGPPPQGCGPLLRQDMVDVQDPRDVRVLRAALHVHGLRALGQLAAQLGLHPPHVHNLAGRRPAGPPALPHLPKGAFSQFRLELDVAQVLGVGVQHGGRVSHGFLFTLAIGRVIHDALHAYLLQRMDGGCHRPVAAQRRCLHAPFQLLAIHGGRA
mmetsp:Transcript_22978/g.57886  ORF Transcript_22978/g.57886 Transcript_22978/m.57886 type:complete len:248 (+) Transcript_22978:352-1095(+)